MILLSEVLLLINLLMVLETNVLQFETNQICIIIKESQI